MVVLNSLYLINIAHDASFDVAMIYDILLNKYSTEKKIMYHCLQNAESTITRSRNSPTKRKVSTQTNNPTAKKKKETTIPTNQYGTMFNFFFNPTKSLTVITNKLISSKQPHQNSINYYCIYIIYEYYSINCYL